MLKVDVCSIWPCSQFWLAEYWEQWGEIHVSLQEEGGGGGGGGRE